MQSDQFHSRFAIALLGQAKDPAVAGVLFGYVTLDAAISLPEGVPDEAFSNAVGKSPATVATAAAATRDEALLKKFARDTRTTVRRVVAANPATGLESLSYLNKWAHRQADAEALSILASRCPATETLGFVFEYPRASTDSFYPWVQLGQVAARELSRAEFLKALASLRTIEGVKPALVESYQARFCVGIAEGLHADIGLDELAEGYPELTREPFLRECVRHATTLDVRAATALALAFTDEAATLPHDQYRMKTSLPADAVTILLAAASEALARWVGQAVADDPAALAAVCDSGNAVAINTVAPRYAKAWSEHQVRQIVAATELSRESAGQLLRVSSVVPDEMVVGLLRQAEVLVTIDWLSGKLAYLPTELQILDLLAEAGDAFAGPLGHMSWSASGSHHNKRSDPAERMAVLENHWPVVLKQPWASVLVDAFGPAFVAYTVKSREAAAHLVARATEAFGARPNAWRYLLSMAPDWQLSLGALIDTALMAE